MVELMAQFMGHEFCAAPALVASLCCPTALASVGASAACIASELPRGDAVELARGEFDIADAQGGAQA